jgi:hypothetical protein
MEGRPLLVTLLLTVGNFEFLVRFQTTFVSLTHVLGHIVIYLFIALSRLYWIRATFKKAHYGFTGTRFEVW